MELHRTASWTPTGFLQLVVLTLAYFTVATLGLRLSIPETNATAIWVPTGLAMAAVLRFGPRVWPAILLGSFAANGLILAKLGLTVIPLLGASLATSIGNTAEALLAGFLIERSTGTRHPFDRVKHVLQFILVGAVLATAVSALVGTATFCAVTGRWPLFRTMGPAWWLGDAVGALVVVPLLLAFRKEELFSLPFKIHRDALLAGLLVLAFWFGICPLLPPLAFFFFPLLVLGTSRLGSFYASALVALLAILATTATLWGFGPIILPGTRSAALLLQQGFIGTLAITTLVLASALQEKRSLTARLLLHNRLYRTLSEVNQAIVRAEDRGTLLKEACRLLVDLGGFRMAWVGFKNEATGCVVPEASAGIVEGFLDDIIIRWDDSPEALGPTGLALREGRGVIFQDCLNDPAFAPWRASALAQGFQTSCAFPIRQGGTVSAALMAYHGEPNAIGSEEGRLLEELAGDLGYALTALETRKDLTESERRLRSTMENVKLLAITLSAGGAIDFCNDYLLRLTGWARGEVLGRNWFDAFVPPEARQEVEAVLTPSIESGEVRIHHENEILTRSGERRLIRWSNTTLRDRNGSVIGTVSLGEDITDQQKAEAALLQQAAELSTLNSLGTRLSNTLDLPTCARAALEGILAATSSDLALLFLREGESLQFLDSVAPAIGLFQQGAPDHLVEQHLCDLGAREGRALYAMDIATDSRCTWAECKRSGTKSFAVLPLKTGDEVIGVLGLASAAPRDFKVQSTFLETLAAQAAAGIQNALLH
jgi:PAS domain S-box-containing protein